MIEALVMDPKVSSHPRRCRRCAMLSLPAGRKDEAMEPRLSRLIYRNEAILEELYSFAAIWNPFKRGFFLLHRAARFNIDRHVLVERT